MPASTEDVGTAVAAPARSQRLLRWLPALLGLGLAGAGLGALGFASQGLRFTLAPAEEPGAEVDPLALLRDDVSSLQRDLGGLSEGLGSNLEALARALDQAGEARAEAQTVRLAALDRRLTQLLERQAALEARLAELARRPLATTAEPSPADAQGPAEGPPVAAAEPSPAEVAAAPEPAPAEEAPAPRRSGGLFSFKATGGLDLDERLRFQVIPSLSRVGFDAKSTLHDFSGVTSEVEGEVALRLADPARDGEGAVSANPATLKTGVDGRDEEMRKRLESDRFPEIRFTMRGFKEAKVDREAKTVSGQVEGELTIHGVTRAIAVPVKIEVDPSKRLVLSGEAMIKMSDFGVEPPDIGPISVEDQVKLWLSLRLRSLGKAEVGR